MDDGFGPGVLVGLALGLLVGTFLTVLTVKSMQETAAATECAYYDPETAAFTWGKLDG